MKSPINWIMRRPEPPIQPHWLIPALREMTADEKLSHELNVALAWGLTALPGWLENPTLTERLMATADLAGVDFVEVRTLLTVKDYEEHYALFSGQGSERRQAAGEEGSEPFRVASTEVGVSFSVPKVDQGTS